MKTKTKTKITLKMSLTYMVLSFALAASAADGVRSLNPDNMITGAAKSPFSEGTETNLSPQQIQSLQEWAKTTKAVLDDYMDSARSLRTKTEAIALLKKGIQEAVLSSQKQNTELLMRYILNRGLVILDILESETSGNNVASQDTKIRLLEQSIEKALFYYNADMNYLAKMRPGTVPSVNIAFASFGIDYAKFLMDLSNSVFDASAQYQLYRLSLGLLQWDLNRDNDRLKYAEQITKIYTRLQTLPKESSPDDQVSVDLIRKMKKTALSLGLMPAAKQSDGAIFYPGVMTNRATSNKFVYGANGSYYAFASSPYAGTYCASYTSAGQKISEENITKCEQNIGVYYKWYTTSYAGTACYIWAGYTDWRLRETDRVKCE